MAALFIETEYGGRKELQALMAETPSYRRDALKALSECLTERRIGHAIERESRRRKISLAELRILDDINRNIDAIWEELAEMSVKSATSWLAERLDEYNARPDFSDQRGRKTAARVRRLSAAFRDRSAA